MGCSTRREAALGEYLAGEGVAFLFAQAGSEWLILGNRRVIRKFFCLGSDVLGHGLQLAEASYFGTGVRWVGEDHGLRGLVARGSEGLPPEVGIVAIGEGVGGRGGSVELGFAEIEGGVDGGVG